MGKTNERYKENAETIRKSSVEIVRAAKPFIKKVYVEMVTDSDKGFKNIREYEEERKDFFIRELYVLANSGLPETEKFDQAYSNLIRVVESSTASRALKIMSGLEELFVGSSHTFSDSISKKLNRDLSK